MAFTMKKHKNIAVFLDRDGTINVERNYVNKVSDFMLLPDAADAIRTINQSGLKVIVASNQSGVARGYLTIKTLGRITTKMHLQLGRKGAHVDAVYYCPFHPDDKPYCRKPSVGMAMEAKQQFGVDLKKCYMVGDNKVDMEFGQNMGATNVLVLTGHARGDEPWMKKVAIHCIAENLTGAVMWILRDLKKTTKTTKTIKNGKTKVRERNRSRSRGPRNR
jgi:D-glycero-D-manno-heptose 1,7-bisphosphate phosphatase